MPLTCFASLKYGVMLLKPGDDGLNLEFFEDRLSHEDGSISWVIVGEALADIEPGAELLIDYTEFQLPRFYLQFCASHGFTDVRSAVLGAADGPT
eukprot:COSAG05_NODE_505_length_9196_cov_3.893591_11_plen_95_part_00